MSISDLESSQVDAVSHFPLRWRVLSWRLRRNCPVDPASIVNYRPGATIQVQVPDHIRIAMAEIQGLRLIPLFTFSADPRLKGSSIIVEGTTLEVGKTARTFRVAGHAALADATAPKGAE